jgi:cold shock CspA family protein
VTSVQATVAEFDEATQGGTALLDDGTTVRFDAAAFAVSGLRSLRLGQRVRIDHDEDDRVVRVTLITLP